MRLEGSKLNTIMYEIILVALIFGIHIWGFWDYDVLVVLMDEFSYWEHAATFAGHDWREVIGRAPWYAYGYSVLLTPLFWMFDKMTTMYRAAIWMNGAMAVGIYFVVKALLRRLYPDSSEKLKMVVATTICLYSAYVGQSKLAWAELAIILTFWLLLLFFMISLEKKSLGWSIAVSVLTGVCYIIHNRMIVIIIALLMMAVFMKLGRKISWKRMFALIVPVLVLYMVNDGIKSQLQQYLATATGLEYGLNDISSRAWKLKALFSLEGLRNAIQTALGELIYVNLATFSVGMIGIYCVIKEILVKLFQKEKTEEQSNRMYFLMFALLAFLGEWGISTLVNMPMDDTVGEKLVTYLYYGRYVDGVIGIFIVMGLIYLLEHRTKLVLGEALLGHSFLFGASILVYQYSKGFDNQLMNSICIPGMWYVDRIEGLNVIIYTAILAVGMLIALFIYQIRKDEDGEKRKIYFCRFITVLFLVIGISYSVIRIGAYREHKENVFEWTEDYVGDNEIYCLKYERAKYFVQAELYDKEIHLIQEEEVAALDENCFLVTEQEMDEENLHLCIRNYRYFVYVTDGEVYEELLKYGRVQPKEE